MLASEIVSRQFPLSVLMSRVSELLKQVVVSVFSTELFVVIPNVL